MSRVAKVAVITSAAALGSMLLGASASNSGMNPAYGNLNRRRRH